MVQTAQIAVNDANIHFDKLYSYKIPSHLAALAHIGSMVLVPFGKGNRFRMGIILQLSQQEENPKIKEVQDIAPEQARLTPELLQIVHFLKDRTFCTWYDAVKTIIPYGAQYKPTIIDGKACLKKQIIKHTETQYTLLHPLPNKPKPSQKQKLAETLLSNGSKTISTLTEKGLTRSVLDNLVKKGVLSKQEVDKTLHDVSAGLNFSQEIFLSQQQQKVFEGLKNHLNGQPATALLHGITASGKTIVFIKLIEETLKQGKQALVLVPEIGLTPQMIQRLTAIFGNAVAVQHSALNHTERLLQWIDIQKGNAKIVVGTRSAVFAPLEKIGLIIIDEEHERTYHSESSPRYSAHEIAKLRALSHKALLLLSSATPSIESYFAAQNGKYHLYELTQRYSNQLLPTVEMVDMRQELMQGNSSQLSNRLRVELAQNLKNHQQSILLLNRRGYQTVAMCSDCGEVLKCTACSVPMVYHKADQKLLCHYCGKTIQPVPQTCPVCQGKLRYTGFGTQKIEEELVETFPHARILRMDQDSTMKKESHKILFDKFAKGEYDILLGTQMVAKGLDFPRVSLVGVLGIDQMLFGQGYRAYEIVFSLVTQVIGRSGRSDLPGRALIQTVDPRNSILQLAAKQDYKTFYNQEIAFRKLNLYPPFCGVCMVLFTGSKEQAVLQAAVKFSEILAKTAAFRPDLPLRVLGPAPLNIAMVNHSYRYKLTIKCKPNKEFRELMRQVLEQYAKQGLPAKATVVLDMHSDADL